MSINDLFVYGKTGKVLGPETRARVGQRIAALEAENAKHRAFCDDIRRENENLHERLNRLIDERDGSVWIWQGDEEDHPESLSCPILISADQMRGILAENAKLREEVERERMRLTACGVVAMADTPETAAKARDMHPDFRSASCDDVARMVDACIRLRGEAAKLRDLLRRIYAHPEVHLTKGMWSEIKSAIEPGNPGEAAAPEPATVAEAPAAVCAGCNVRPPCEHRCHDRATCGCKECREADEERSHVRAGDDE